MIMNLKIIEIDICMTVLTFACPLRLLVQAYLGCLLMCRIGQTQPKIEILYFETVDKYKTKNWLAILRDLMQIKECYDTHILHCP